MALVDVPSDATASDLMAIFGITQDSESDSEGQDSESDDNTISAIAQAINNAKETPEEIERRRRRDYDQNYMMARLGLDTPYVKAKIQDNIEHDDENDPTASNGMK
jgi:hypothetical protein